MKLFFYQVLLALQLTCLEAESVAVAALGLRQEVATPPPSPLGHDHLASAKCAQISRDFHPRSVHRRCVDVGCVLVELFAGTCVGDEVVIGGGCVGSFFFLIKEILSVIIIFGVCLCLLQSIRTR